MDYFICSKCGAKIEKESVYCRKCGTKIDVDVAPKTKTSWFWIVAAIVAFILVAVAVVMVFYSQSDARYFDRIIDKTEKIGYRREYNRVQNNPGGAKWDEDVIVIETDNNTSTGYKCTSKTGHFDGAVRVKSKDKTNYSYSIPEDKVAEFKELIKASKDIGGTKKYIEANGVSIDEDSIENVMIIVDSYEQSNDMDVSVVINSDLKNDRRTSDTKEFELYCYNKQSILDYFDRLDSDAKK